VISWPSLSTSMGLRRSGRPSRSSSTSRRPAARALIRAMPDGIYTHEIISTTTAPATSPCRFALKVVVAGDEMTLDYSGIAEQVKGPINSWLVRWRPDYGARRVQYLMGAGEMANEGTFRPLKAGAAARQDPQADATARWATIQRRSRP